MKLLLDTHLLIWASSNSLRLSKLARSFIENLENTLLFSAASLWEITIKHGLHRPDFEVDPRLLRRALLDNEYHELPILTTHVLAVQDLPPLHRDPFDRLLIAQAMVEGITLLTSDVHVAEYAGPIRKV
ncbi:MAG: type II toxin-antitoxin system VapC family toxin [Alphaproteobacteria bacterium]|nr:type II toxin-antitoxin system VapC family toxin [Alphaproteobacteria bacterium]